MIKEIIMFIVGLAFLIKGSDKFVGSASRVAKGFGVSEFLIALILASVATTLPEVTVSAMAAYVGESGIAIGNAVGSALANIALILGICSLIRPLKVEEMAWRNSLFMVAVTAYAWFLMYDGTISRPEGFSLMLIYLGFLYYLYKRHASIGEVNESRGNPKREAVIMFLSGMVVVIGAKMVVNGAVTLARAFGVPEVVIGLTMLSVGTSLPELANSLAATFKRLPNISVGNVIGANIMDILMVIGIAAIIRPIQVDWSIITFTMPITLLVMLTLTSSLILGHKVDRKVGAFLVLVYSYFIYMYVQSMH